jgi:glutathione S-transferase
LAHYFSVEAARPMSGLRLVVTAHVPGLWSEAAKGLFDSKRIPYVLVEQVVGGENRALKEWTAQTSGPVAMWEDERPRATWLEQLYLAERLAPQPALIPSVLEDRLLMFGLCNELCSENGFAWNVRMATLHRNLTNPKADEGSRQVSRHLADKYGYSPDLLRAAHDQIAGILGRLKAQLSSQEKLGRRYLIGASLSALDIYWAAFAGAVDPLPPELCPNMPENMRRNYTAPDLKQIGGDALFAHRDRIYSTHLKLPMDF